MTFQRRTLFIGPKFLADHGWRGNMPAMSFRYLLDGFSSEPSSD